MRYFVCLLDQEGRQISDEVRRAYEALPRSRRFTFEWLSDDHAPVLISGDDPDGTPLVVSAGTCLAAGMARLDNSSDLERWTGCTGQHLCDLALVLRTVARYGPTYVPRLLGDFGFVVWNRATRTAVVACDPFRVKKLYYAEHRGVFAFASRGEALVVDDQYDIQYLAELVGMAISSPERSPYAGVQSVPAGSVGVLQDGQFTMREYWSAYSFRPDPSWARKEREAAENCRSLLAESVRLRLGHGENAWAQLSGGIDSSSITGLAQFQLEQGTIARGLSGTVTYVDQQGSGTDERRYSNAVARQWGLRNVTIVDPPMWQDDSFAPPQLDKPGLNLPLYPRERRLCDVVRGAGGQVLLTGVGGDELFAGTMLFFADWVVGGRAWLAVREMVRRAAIGRVSFWELAYRNACLPLLPPILQRHLVRDQGQMPPWVLPAAARRYGLKESTFVTSTYAGPIGQKYRYAIAAHVVELGRDLNYGLIEDTLDVRHPFLYRPLVEFALQLPPELCSRPQARKWVLREAMRGVLPDAVRTRVGKGTPTELFAWSLTAQRALLEPLVRDSILADLGVIDSAKLLAAFDAAPQQPRRREELHGLVQSTLVVEAWLQMRCGRWPRGDTSRAAGRRRVHYPST